MKSRTTIKIQGLSLEYSHGDFRPRFQCDSCHDFVNAPDEAMVFWHDHSVSAKVLHKDCVDTIDSYTVDIGVIATQLLGNSGIKTEIQRRQWQDNADFMGRH